jgi:uncharacterized repeat protein (TIGR03803 family)
MAVYVIAASLMLTAAHAATYRQISSLDESNGFLLTAGVIEDAAGTLYGAASYGGLYNDGTIFKLPARGTPTPQKLYDLTDAGIARPVVHFAPWQPNASLLLGRDGSLYGTSSYGGVNCGTVFRLTKARKMETLLNFNISKAFPGCTPVTPLLQDGNGNLLGTAPPVLFSLSPTGKETVLHKFCRGKDGCLSTLTTGGVILGSGGTIYGTTDGGGRYGFGTVFKIAPDGTETILYDFTGGADGGEPVGGVVQDKAGNLYGTTFGGGENCPDAIDLSGCGTVFKLAPDGTETVLHTFTGGDDGEVPDGNLVIGHDGTIYGTASYEGKYGWGTAYQITPVGSFTVIHAFSSGFDGNGPGPLYEDKAGRIFGTTLYGGRFSHGEGTIYEIIP